MRVEDRIEFDRRMRELRRALYELAGWLDAGGFTDSSQQVDAVLTRLQLVRTAFAAERDEESDDDE